MHRIDGFGHVGNLFTEGDPQIGQPATRVTDDWLNDVQENLMAVLLDGGIAPTKGRAEDLRDAIRNMILTLQGFTTGDVKPTLKAVADPGWVMLNDGSIGNASSGATTRAHADTEALFTLLWTNVTNSWCPVQDSMGTPVARGASAAADFAANRRLVLPKALGRALGAAGAGAGLTARSLGQILGEEAHALTSDENGPHTHTEQRWTNSNDANFANNGSNIRINTLITQNSGSSGSGTPHNNMQPTLFVNWMIKL
ncbi:MAG TPA: hypothetical protein VF406_11770 [Thermodesulfobacteriota bacterium]